MAYKNTMCYINFLLINNIGVIIVVGIKEIVDDRKNIINVCLFESFLAKYFLEHPEIFDSLKEKIFVAIEELIKINSNNPKFERLLFSSFSSLSEQNRSINNLKAVRESRSLIVFDTFLKYFVERVMFVENIIIPSLKSEITASSLQEGGQFTLFKILPPLSPDQLFNKMRPITVFSDQNRGVISIEDEDLDDANSNIGILSPKDTPAQLVDYLTFPNYPSRQCYLPKEDSEMAKWLRAHCLPVISGASGGVGKTISSLAKLMDFSANDYMLMGLLIASSTVALGHHSFFEVMRPLSFVTGCLQEQKDLLAFYEQVIPTEVKELGSYKSHIHGTDGASLIEEICFEPECDNVSVQRQCMQ